MSRFSNYDEELKINAVEDNGVYASGDKIKDYIPSMEDKDLENFIIIGSKLLYIGKNELESQIAEKLKLGGSTDVSDVGAVVEEVQQIVDNVVEVKEENKDKVPVGDSDKLEDLEKLKAEGKEQYTDDSEGLIGVRLFTRNGLNLNNGNWNILIEYNTSNREIARYGSGYYWLKKGTIYKINGEEIEFKNDYVVDYSKGEYYVLSGRAVNWNVDATLGVPDEIVDGKHTLALNLDPMNLANGEWVDSGERDEVNNENFYNFKVENPDGSKVDTGVRKVGDVEYDSKNKALKFNQDKENNQTGEGGYMRLEKKGLDFSNGFTFEIYANLDRIIYKNTLNSFPNFEHYASGLFCKAPSLLVGNVTKIMRFGYVENGCICKFFDPSSWYGQGNKLKTQNDGSVISKSCGYEENEDFFLTFVYRDFKDGRDDPDYDANMIDNKVDKIEYYINGEIFGSTYYGGDSYDSGRKNWGSDDSKFFIGVCPWFDCGNLFYMKGLLYATRLYSKPLTSDEVKLNYDMTLKYRDSFKNE